MRFEPAGFLLSCDASILQEDVKANRGWNVCCHLEAKILWFWEKRSNKWNTRGQILFKNVSTFNLRRRKEGILLCGTWTCLNGNKLSYKISTNSYIQWLFDMDLPSCMALQGLSHKCWSSFQSDPRTRGETIMLQAMQVFSSILPSRDFLPWVIWLPSLGAKQIFEGWRKRAQSYFLKRWLFLSWEWLSGNRSFVISTISP